MTLSKVAYFAACPNCQRHGAVISASGAQLPCYHKPMGYEAIDRMRQANYVSDDEAKVLREQIAQSNMPEQAGFIVLNEKCMRGAVILPPAPTKPAPKTTRPLRDLTGELILGAAHNGSINVNNPYHGKAHRFS